MRTKFVFLPVIFLLCFLAQAQNPVRSFVITDTSFHNDLLELDGSWKIKNGDDQHWSSAAFDDSRWDSAYSALDFDNNGQNIFTGRAWLRFHFFSDSAISKIPLSFLMGQQGAAEIYLDGRLIHMLGKIETTGEKKFNAGNFLFTFPVMQSGNHVLSVRYSNHNCKALYEKYNFETAGFRFILVKQDNAVEAIVSKTTINYTVILSLGIFFLTLAFLHFLLFLFYRKERSNLFYSGFVASLSALFLFPSLANHIHNPETTLKIQFYVFYFLPFFFAALIAMLSYILFRKMLKTFWVMLAAIPFVFLSKYILSDRWSGLISFTYIFASVVISFSFVITGIRKKKEGAKIIGTGTLFFLLFLSFLIVRNMFGYGTFIRLELETVTDFILLAATIFAIMSIPLSMSVHLARNFAQTNRSLQDKLQEVEELSAKSIRQEKEKQKILESQKDELEKQVTERTSEILQQKQLIEEKNKEVTDSIKYASRIQRALLTQESYIQKQLRKWK